MFKKGITDLFLLQLIEITHFVKILNSLLVFLLNYFHFKKNEQNIS